MCVLFAVVDLPTASGFVWAVAIFGAVLIAAGGFWGFRDSREARKQAASAGEEAFNANADDAVRTAALEQVTAVLEALKGMTGYNLLMAIGFGLILVATVIAYPDITVVVNE